MLRNIEGQKHLDNNRNDKKYFQNPQIGRGQGNWMKKIIGLHERRAQ